MEIEVTPTQAQQILYAQNNGSLSVALVATGYEEENLDPTDEDSIENFSSKSNSSSGNGYIINNKSSDD